VHSRVSGGLLEIQGIAMIDAMLKSDNNEEIRRQQTKSNRRCA
jgi:hypothetical protein